MCRILSGVTIRSVALSVIVGAGLLVGCGATSSAAAAHPVDRRALARAVSQVVGHRVGPADPRLDALDRAARHWCGLSRGSMRLAATLRSSIPEQELEMVEVRFYCPRRVGEWRRDLYGN